MKIKLLTFLLASFVLVTTAEAKVYYKNKPIVDTHVLTIKGFLYELSHGVVSPQAVHRRSSYAKALVWLERMRKSPKVYKLEKLKNEEALLITRTIGTLVKIFTGKFGIDPEYAVKRWTGLGQRVVVEYSQQTIVNPTTGQQKVKVKWKFTLKTNQPKTNQRRGFRDSKTNQRRGFRDLLYRS